MHPDKYLAAEKYRERWYQVGLLAATGITIGITAILLICFKRPLPTEKLWLLSTPLVPWVVLAVVLAFWRRSDFFALPLACPECEVQIGQLHIPGCTLEDCPFCGGEIVGCGCIHTVLGLSAEESKYVESYLDASIEPIKSILERWNRALEQKGRLPYGPRRLAIQISRDQIENGIILHDVTIAKDSATAVYRTQDGSAIPVTFRWIKYGWIMEDD